jgi:hypothetical protein
MSTVVRVVVVTKPDNSLCDKSHVELTLRVMPPGTETAVLGFLHHGNEVFA